MKDGMGGGVYVMPALLAAKRPTANDEVMLGDTPAFLARDAIRPAVVFKPLEASGIVGEVLHKVAQRVPFHALSIL